MFQVLYVKQSRFGCLMGYCQSKKCSLKHVITEQKMTTKSNTLNSIKSEIDFFDTLCRLSILKIV